MATTFTPCIPSLLMLLALSIPLADAGQLTVSLDQMFLVNGSLVRAADLNPGDNIMAVDGKTVRILALKDVASSSPQSAYGIATDRSGFPLAFGEAGILSACMRSEASLQNRYTRISALPTSESIRFRGVSPSASLPLMSPFPGVRDPTHRQDIPSTCMKYLTVSPQGHYVANRNVINQTTFKEINRCLSEIGLRNVHVGTN